LGTEKTDPVRKNGQPEIQRGRYLLFLVAGTLVLLLVAGNLIYGATQYTRNDRSYCLGCHTLNEPERMWEPSKMHSGGLACSPCHGVLPDQQGRCGGFSAHPATVNPNCMGCHPRVVEGKPLNRVVEVRRVPARDGGTGDLMASWSLEDLMYKWHVGNKVCLCTDCHRNISHEKGEEAPGFRNRPKIAYCGECHYHQAKDSYVQISPLPELLVRESGEGEEGS
jgi:hypothetical protein